MSNFLEIFNTIIGVFGFGISIWTLFTAKTVKDEVSSIKSKIYIKNNWIEYISKFDAILSLLDSEFPDNKIESHTIDLLSELEVNCDFLSKKDKKLFSKTFQQLNQIDSQLNKNALRQNLVKIRSIISKEIGNYDQSK